MTSGYLCLWALGLALALPAAATAEEVAELIKGLETDRPKASRTEVVRKLRDIKGPEGLKAVPSLARLLEDKDAEIREEAITAIGTITYLNKQPCPVALVKSLFDGNADVRLTACTYVGVFEKYPAEARALLLRALEHTDANVRSTAIHPLARVWGKEKEVLAAVKKATKDKNLSVRHNAYAALWSISQDLDLVLPHWLQAVEGMADLKPEVELATQEAKFEQASATLIGLGSAVKLFELTAERPADLAKALLKLLADDSPIIRRAAARTLGAMAVDPKQTTPLLKDLPPDSPGLKLPVVDHKKVKAILKDLEVDAAVRKLLADPDEKVRANAETALKRLTD